MFSGTFDKSEIRSFEQTKNHVPTVFLEPAKTKETMILFLSGRMDFFSTNLSIFLVSRLCQLFFDLNRIVDFHACITKRTLTILTNHLTRVESFELRISKENLEITQEEQNNQTMS